jgi:hypothetical protein
MQRITKLALAGALVLLKWQPAEAQEPLQVIVESGVHHQHEPILVHITNVSTGNLRLVLPMYHPPHVISNLYSKLASDPLDVERKNGRRWTEVPLAFAGPKPKGSPEIQPGDTMECKFGVFGAGEYRVRVWYVVSPPSLGPPPRPPRYASVVSMPLRID